MKKSWYILFIAVFLLFEIFVPLAQYSNAQTEEIIASDNFSTGTVGGGTGWSGNWTLTGSSSIQNSDYYSASYGARMVNYNAIMERTLDLTGVTGGKLGFWWKIVNFNGSDTAYVEVYDGQWNTVLTVNRNSPSGSYREAQIDLSGYNMVSDFKIRLRSGMNKNNEYFYVDDIIVRGIKGTSTSPTPTPSVSERIRVQMYNEDRSGTTNQLRNRFFVTNQGTTSINLSELKIRYYYTIDGVKPQNFYCDWSNIGSSKITGNFFSMPVTTTNADYYFEVGFTADAGQLAPSSSVEILTRVAKSDWSNYTQGNDYSFNSTSTSLVNWDKVTGYIRGTNIWGVEPVVNTPTPNTTPGGTPVYTSTPVVSENITVQMFNGDKSVTINTLYPRFRIVNQGSVTVNLSELKIRYYYTIDGVVNQNFFCDWSTVGSTNVNGSFYSMPLATSNADYYLEMGFNSGAGQLIPGGSIEIQGRIAKSDWSNYSQGNDYSFNSSSTNYIDWDKTTGYIRGNLVWGIEPISTTPTPSPSSLPTSTPTPTLTPTPTNTPELIIPGKFYMIEAKHSMKYIDVSDELLTDGSNVIQYQYTGGSNQKWYTESFSSGVYKLRAGHSGLNLAATSLHEGSNVVQSNIFYDDWTLESVGGGYCKIISKDTNYVLSVDQGSTLDKANIIIQSYVGGDNQLWKFVEVSPIVIPTPTPMPTGINITGVYEAEDALLSGPVFSDIHLGYTGMGFADYINNTTDYIQWSVNTTNEGEYKLSIRYANGSTTSRPLQIMVNGVVVNSGLQFSPTGAWTTWVYVDINVNLISGNNLIRAVATGSSGPNVDHLKIVSLFTVEPTPTPTISPTPTATATQIPTPTSTPGPTPTPTPTSTPGPTPSPTNTPIPMPTPTPAQGQGLRGEYYNNIDFTDIKDIRIDEQINFDWGGYTPSIHLPQGDFSVRWMGKIEPRFTEEYTFYIMSQNPVRLYVNNILIIDNWTSHDLGEDFGSIGLTAGIKYDIRLELSKEVEQDATIQLSWSSYGQVKEIIPKSQLFIPKTYNVINHSVRTYSNNFTIGDYVPVEINLNVLWDIKDPVVSIDLSLKKTDGSDSGFKLKEIKTGGILKNDMFKVLLNNYFIEDYSVWIDEWGGQRKLKIKVGRDLSYGDIVEIRYTSKLAGEEDVYNEGVYEYLLSNGLYDSELKIDFEVSEWLDMGIFQNRPYDSQSTWDSSESLAFSSYIRVEDPLVLE